MFEKEDKDIFIPTDEQRKFLMTLYEWTQDDLALRQQSWQILNRRSISQFWNDSINDYNVLVPETDANDWVKPYVSSVSRDKSNAFIANIASLQILPQVFAQNDRQEIDVAFSRAGTVALKWGHDNDGFPESSGNQKNVHSVTKTVVEGTAHIQEDFVDGRPVSSLVPNEEMLIPNYWQHEIQKQSRIGRITDNVTYDEAELLYGDLPNWKFVHPGGVDNWWGGGIDNKFKEYKIAFPAENRVQILRYWWWANSREKYFNLVINGVPMFDVGNKMPYKHGMFPVVKTIFELFSTEFYWGNSLPNKVRQDKNFRDAWKTLIRAKGKISLLPPLVAAEGAGNLVDEDIWIPGRITSITGDPSKVTTVPGVAKEVSQNDVAILELTDKEIDQGTAAPIVQGLSEGGRVTARQILLQQSNAQKLLGLFGLMRKFAVEAQGRLRIMNILQFVPKSKWRKLIVSDVTLSSGRKGTMEVIFERVKDLSADERMKESLNLLEQEEASVTPKEIIKVDPEFARSLDLYVTVAGNPATMPSSELQQELVLEKAPVYQSLGMNLTAIQRMVARAFGDNEDELVVEQALPVSPGGGIPAKSPQSPLAMLKQTAAGM